MKGVKRAVRAFSAGALLFFAIGMEKAAFGANRFEQTAYDQSFTTGYDQLAYSEKSLQETSYALLVPEEKKKEETAAKEEEERRFVDTWRFFRTARHSTTYTSNVGATRLDPEDDFIHTESLALSMTRKSRYNYVGLFYDLSYSYNVEDEKKHAFGNSIKTNFGYTFGHLTIDIDNSVSPQRSIAAGERSELETAGKAFALAVTDNLNTRIELKASRRLKLSWDTRYALFYLPVADNSLSVNEFSSHTYVFGPTVNFQWTPRVNVGASYQYEIIDYFKGDLDSRSHLPGLQAGFQLGPKTTIGGTIGLRARNYKDSDRPSVESPKWSISIGRKLAQKLALNLTTTEDTLEDFDATTHSPSKQTNRYYAADLDWAIGPKWSATLGGSAGFQESDKTETKADPDNPFIFFTRPLEDEIFEWYARLRWTPRPYLAASAGYQFINKNSSFKDNEYEDHRFTTTVNARF